MDNYTLEQFRGLNFKQSPYEMGMEWATIASDVEILVRGEVKQRRSFNTISQTAPAATVQFLLQRGLQILSLAANSSGSAEISLYNSVGAKSTPTGSPTWTAKQITPPATFGASAGAPLTFVASTNDLAGVQLKKYDDVAGSVANSSATSKPQFVAVYPGQNRLAQIGFFAAADAPGGANGDAATVFFSDEGAPETFGATHFQRLDPGDGETFTAAVGYQNQLIVFKNSKLYTFYGVSPDDDGEPLFDYKTHALPDPIPSTARPTAWVPACIGPDGVYFIGQGGLWKTTGGAPSRIDTPIDPIFSDRLNSYRIDTPGEVRMGFAGNMLFMQYTSFTNPVTMVWNRDTDAWYAWFPMRGFTATPIIYTRTGDMWAAGLDIVSGVAIFKATVGTSDDSASANDTPIQWTYQTGWTSLGSVYEKRMRFVDVWGHTDGLVNLYTDGRRVAGGTSSAQATVSAVSSNKSNYRLNMPLNGRRFRLELAYNPFFTITEPVGTQRVEFRFASGESQ